MIAMIKTTSADAELNRNPVWRAVALSTTGPVTIGQIVEKSGLREDVVTGMLDKLILQQVVVHAQLQGSSEVKYKILVPTKDW